MNKATVNMAGVAAATKAALLSLAAITCQAQTQTQTQTQARQSRPQAQPETRLASAAEILAFNSWMAARPGGAAAKVGYDIARGGDTRGWRVTAWAERPAQRAAWRLCLATRDGYLYDGKRWSELGQQRRYAWLDRASDCGVAPQRVHLKQPLGERDIVTVLEQQATILQHARLLFAGNTQCAPQRAHKFELAAIDPGPGQFYQLSYVSDRGGSAVITVRKRARELTAWAARC